MKKTKAIIFILTLYFLFYTDFSLAFPLKGPKWEGKNINDIFVTFYEDAFLDSYETTEANSDSVSTCEAFALMGRLYSGKNLRGKLMKNKIASPALKALLTELIAKTENPQTAKDYLYKGLFAFPWPDNPDLTDNFIYIIENFPDTVHAKYSYPFLASAYMLSHRHADAIRVLNNYNVKYTTSSDLSIAVDSLFLELNYNNDFDLIQGETNKEVKIPEETAEEIVRNEAFLQYANKILSEHAEEKEVTGDVFLKLGNYYRYHKDYTKSMEYYNRVYNDSGFKIGKIDSAIFNIIWTYKEIGQIVKLDTFLKEVKSRYFHDKSVRRHYKEAKQLILEIQNFGYDRHDRSEAGMKVYEKKATQIKAFRAEYDKCFDADFNLIKPIESIKIGEESGK